MVDETLVRLEEEAEGPEKTETGREGEKTPAPISETSNETSEPIDGRQWFNPEHHIFIAGARKIKKGRHLKKKSPSA